MANPAGRNPKYDTVIAKRNIITVAGTTRTLNEKESGSLVLIAAVATTITLPKAVIGLTYDFACTVTSTSSQKIITGAATELLIGNLISLDNDTGNVLVGFPSIAATSNIAVTMSGTTTGGIISTRLTFTCLNSTRWLVEGTLVGNGTVATPFTTS